MKALAMIDETIAPNATHAHAYQGAARIASTCPCSSAAEAAIMVGAEKSAIQVCITHGLGPAPILRTKAAPKPYMQAAPATKASGAHCANTAGSKLIEAAPRN